MADKKKSAKPREMRAAAAKSATSKKSVGPERAPPAIIASKYAIGDEVSHPMFGLGIVTGIDANKLTIDFPDNVTKQIVDGYVKHRNSA